MEGDKEIEVYIDTDDEEEVFWPRLKDYDGDIEEEKRKIEERVSKIEDPEKVKRYMRNSYML